MKSPLSFLTSWVALALVASACSDARPADGDATSNATLADAGAGTSSDVPEGATPACR